MTGREDSANGPLSTFASIKALYDAIENTKKRIFCAPERFEAVRHEVYEVQGLGGWYTVIAHPWMAGTSTVVVGLSLAEQEIAFDRCTEWLFYGYSPLSSRWDVLQELATEMEWRSTSQ